MKDSYFSTALQVFAAAEAARRFNARAAEVEEPCAGLLDQAASLAAEAAEWREIAADPANRREVRVIEDALTEASGLSRQALRLRRQAESLAAKAAKIRGRAAEFSREANQANRQYLAWAKAEQAEAQRQIQAAAAAENRRKAEAARARRQRREERQARENVAALFARKAAANAVAL